MLKRPWSRLECVQHKATSINGIETDSTIWFQGSGRLAIRVIGSHRYRHLLPQKRVNHAITVSTSHLQGSIRDSEQYESQRLWISYSSCNMPCLHGASTGYGHQPRRQLLRCSGHNCVQIYNDYMVTNSVRKNIVDIVFIV